MLAHIQNVPSLLCCVVLCCVLLCCVVLHSAVSYCVVSSNVMLRSFVFCCPLFCSLFCFLLHNTTPHDTTQRTKMVCEHNNTTPPVFLCCHKGNTWGCVRVGSMLAQYRGGGVSMLGGCVNMPIALGLQTFRVTTHIVDCASRLFPIVSTHQCTHAYPFPRWHNTGNNLGFC